MAIQNKKVISENQIKKFVKSGKKVFEGKTKNYPLCDKDGNLLVVKIEVKTETDSGLYAVLHTAKGNSQKDYDPKAYAKRQVKKYEKIAKLRIPKIKDKQIKLIVDLAIATGIRAGSTDDSTGLTNLKRGNIRFDRVSQKRCVLDFEGKCGVQQNIIVEGSLSTRLKKFVLAKRIGEKLFDVSYPQVNSALKKINLKDFRTKLANDLAWEYVKSLNGSSSKTKKEYTDRVKELCGVVAHQLGHKKGDGDLNLGTSKKSYIDPKVFQTLSAKVKNKEKILTKVERRIAKKGSMWEKRLLPVMV